MQLNKIHIAFILLFLSFIILKTNNVNSIEINNKINKEWVIEGAKLPPKTSVLPAKKYPLLVNYFHMNFEESGVNNKEERLAQWDVLILNPDDVVSEGISLSKIRKVNPDIKILVWIPFGQEPHNSMAISKNIPQENDPDNWFGKTINGQYIKPHWGGHLMNPYKMDFSYPKYVLKYIKKNYLDNKLYDGVMLDVLSEYAPTFASQDYPQTFDTNEDHVFNDKDNMLYRQGVNYLLKNLRNDFPDIIITGNGGVPWTADCFYFDYANGNMHENALGNEFGSSEWQDDQYSLWEGFQNCMNPNSSSNFKRYHWICVDIRYNRSQTEALNLKKLSDNDLRRMRLGLCTALLDDGYFCFDRGDCLHGQLWWFDEYDVDIGLPVDKYKSNLYAKGLYGRNFTKGFVVVNPTKFNIKIKLTETYEDVTSKKTGKIFIIPANDGRIFLKKYR